MSRNGWAAFRFSRAPRSARRAARGAIVALLGASGSGKTTLLRCIAGFLGANNIARGRLTALTGDRADIGGEGWTLEGVVKDGHGLAAAAEAQAVIRVERISVSDAPGPHRIVMALDDSLYLGDRPMRSRSTFSTTAFRPTAPKSWTSQRR